MVFMSLPDNEPHGQYPGVFDYWFQRFTEVQDDHYWALLIWDRIIITVIFHDPKCSTVEAPAPVCRSRQK
jgi:hypothetical protein